MNERPPDPRRRMTKHHFLYYSREWSLRPEGLYLREHGGLIADLDRASHDEMHRRTCLVPVLGVHALQRVAAQYEPTQSLYRNVDQFCKLTDEAIRHPKSHSIERRLGELTIEALQEQKEILKEFRKRY